MKIFVRAKPSAKQASVTKLSENTYTVAVREPPVDGRANAAIARALAEHLGVAPSQVRLVAGASARQKLFEVS
ncbi:MAG: DUF167 domain-containing protein [Candidatus Andersenbacteria bacterium]